VLEWFFSVHRPDLNEDLVGFNYRSVIFCTTSDQRDVAEETLRDVDFAGHWPGRIVTRVSEAGPFWEARGRGSARPPALSGRMSIPAHSVAVVSQTSQRVDSVRWRCGSLS
jgi:hypothetical protein